jgi:hypothetical protein
LSKTVVVYPEGTSPDLTGSEQGVLERLAHAVFWVVPGRDRTRRRVVTTLLHGNEPSGFRAIRNFCQSGSEPAVDLAFCVCSVEAALGPPLFVHRVLPGDRDQNRAFLPPFDDPTGHRSRRLLELIVGYRPEALVDLHNNTGHSPAYGVGTRVDSQLLGLTSLFADRFMHSDLRLGTLMEALDSVIPSVVIECGRAGDPIADATALAGLERFAGLEDLALARGGAAGVKVLSRPTRVTVRAGAILAFDERPVACATFTVRRGVDRHNFQAMGAGEVVGWVAPGAEWPIEALGASGDDRSGELFEMVGQEVRLLRSIVPVMMTMSPEIAKSDCLFYALEAEGPAG